MASILQQLTSGFQNDFKVNMFIFLRDFQLCTRPGMFNGKDGTGASAVIESQLCLRSLNPAGLWGCVCGGGGKHSDTASSAQSMSVSRDVSALSV